MGGKIKKRNLKQTGRAELRGKDPRMGCRRLVAQFGGNEQWPTNLITRRSTTQTFPVGWAPELAAGVVAQVNNFQWNAKEECNMEASSWKDSITWLNKVIKGKVNKRSFEKSQIVTIFGFVGRNISIITIQLYHPWGESSHRQHVNAWA